MPAVVRSPGGKRPATFLDLVRKCNISVSTEGTHMDIRIHLRDWNDACMELRVGTIVTKMDTWDIIQNLEEHFPMDTWRVSPHRM